MNYDLYWIWMSCGLGAGASCLDLVTYYEWNPYEIYASSFNELFRLDVITKRQLEKLKAYSLEDAQKIYDTAISNGWKVVTPSSEYYPEQLLTLQNLPLVLYVEGDVEILKNELSISIVGARKASDYGKGVARALSSTMAETGFTIVSGGALGIDSAAHQGALDAVKPTICVLGCGLGTNYLMENEPLRQKIVKNGAVITEFTHEMHPEPFNFVQRNRIIAGMSDGVLVVESAEKGGSLITAELAHSYNRDVMAVSGRTIDTSSIGCNSLIKYNKASLVENAKDIERVMCWEKSSPQSIELFPILSEKESIIVEIIKEKGTAHVDIISQLSGIKISELSAILLNLEFSNVIRSIKGNFYMLY